MNEDALKVLQSSIELGQETVKSWLTVWEDAIFNYQSSFFWIALVSLGLVLGTLSVIYLAITEGKTVLEKSNWQDLVKLLVWPMIILIFLGNNGSLLAQSIQAIRAIGLQQINNIQQIQISGMTLNNALETITISNAAKEQIESLANECNGKQGTDLTECLNTNASKAQEIVNQAQAQSQVELIALQALVGTLFTGAAMIQPGLTSFYLGTQASKIFRSSAMVIIRFILACVQWAFVNILEASLLLSACFAPIAMGLSLLPLQGRPIIAWLISFISLIGIQLGYNIVVGLAAVVIVHSHGELATDVAFLFFLAIFAPVLAIAIANGGGKAIYQGVSSGVKNLIELGTNTIIATAKLFI